MNGPFKHAQPEQELATGQFGAYRRHELHKAAIERNLIDEMAPTPTKPVLIRMLENNISANQANSGSPERPVSLDIAHLSEEDKAKLLAKLQKDADSGETEEPENPLDPFAAIGNDDGENEEKFQFLAAETNVLALTKKFHEMFPDAPKLDKTVKKAEILEGAKRLLGLGDV